MRQSGRVADDELRWEDDGGPPPSHFDNYIPPTMRPKARLTGYALIRALEGHIAACQVDIDTLLSTGHSEGSYFMRSLRREISESQAVIEELKKGQ